MPALEHEEVAMEEKSNLVFDSHGAFDISIDTYMFCYIHISIPCCNLELPLLYFDKNKVIMPQE